jgi:hydrogenase-4 membrane subunit HyfE
MNFLSGMVVMGFLLAGLFFAKFWTRTRDALFAIFAAAFWLLALHQGLLIGGAVPREEQGWTYLLRLAAFSLLAVAIVYKNVSRGSRAE